MRESSTQAVPRTSATPRHVAIIMDGNGRWATARRLPRTAGHRQGVETVREIVEACAKRGVEHLTLFVSSPKNGCRPADEVSLLMNLFMMALEREVTKLHQNGILLRFVGQLDAFLPRLHRSVAAA
ncbi:hypothetical protein BH09PSE6_BH09PSE6_29050 [soil metagenome]